MSDELLAAEDATAQVALDALQAPPGAPRRGAAPAELDAADQILVRQFTEALGLLPQELTPVEPPPALRGLLLSHLAGDETQEIQQAGAYAAFDEELAPVRAGRFGETPAMAAATAPVRAASRWPWALAALFAAAALGLGYWGYDLSERFARQSATVAKQRAELESTKRALAELAAAKRDLAAVRQDFDFATATAALCFTLRPAAGAPAVQGMARGTLWVAADHQHWTLAVRGLKPELEAQDYQLWFLIGTVPVPGGTFDAETGQLATLTAARMPSGTTGVAITLEKKGGSPQPTLPILLVAEQAVQL